VTADPRSGEEQRHGAAGSERLARYLLRPPLSLERMWLAAEGSVLYRRKAPGRFGGAQATFDAMDYHLSISPLGVRRTTHHAVEVPI
jgi:hypothetical protein